MPKTNPPTRPRPAPLVNGLRPTPRPPGRLVEGLRFPPPAAPPGRLVNGLRVPERRGR